MLRKDYDHGFTQQSWDRAKQEAISIMVATARKGSTITYSDLVSKIKSIALTPRDPRLFHFLGEISSEEDDAGRGMLTVLVVHKHGDMEPGKGFYELAKSLGRDVSDPRKCWVDELSRVYAVWSKK